MPLLQFSRCVTRDPLVYLCLPLGRNSRFSNCCSVRCAPAAEASTPVSQDRSDMRNSFLPPPSSMPSPAPSFDGLQSARETPSPLHHRRRPLQTLQPQLELLGSARPLRPPLNPTAQFLRLFGALLTIPLTFSTAPTTGDRNRARAAMAGKSSLRSSARIIHGGGGGVCGVHKTQS